MDTQSTAAGGRICAAGTCGNGRLDAGEVCDDGNNRSGDGCPADCAQPCGDGVVDPDEVCDDGNAFDGDGCSADCRSRDGSLIISPPRVDFAVTEGDALPAAVTVTVRFEFLGDSVLVGYAPGVAQPAWLSIAEGPSNASTAELQLQVTETSVVGPRSTTIRVMIFHRNSAGFESHDLPVSYSVEPSDLAIQATPATLALTAAAGDVVVPSQPVSVTFNGEDVALVAAPSWLTVSSPPGPATSPASFAVSIAGTAFAPGTVLSGDIVFGSTRALLQRRTSVHVDYSVTAPADLAIHAAPESLTFTADAGGAVPPSQTVEVTFTGATVAVVAAPPWVTVSATDPATSPASFTVSANTTSFHGGTVSGDLVFATTRGAQLSTAVHLEYSVQSVLAVEFVAPYVGIAGRGGALYLRGREFPARPVTVRIGDLQLAPVTPDSDTQIALSYPPLPEGRYPVTMVDPPWASPTGPELVIATPPAFRYQAIDAPGLPNRIVYDAERQAIYVANTRDQRIEHFAYSSGSWSALAPHIVPQLSDIAMTPDGRSLIVIARVAISEMSLTDGLFARVERAFVPASPSLCNHFTEAAAANNGRVFVHSGDGASCMAYFYDVLDHSLVEVETYFEGHSAASADGSRIYTNRGSGRYRIYDALSETLSSSPTTWSLPFTGITVSGDASRVILANDRVFDRSLTTDTGSFPSNGVALASRDSRRAFAYSFFETRLEVYDLTTQSVPGGLHPLLETVTFPDKANRTPGHTIRMTSSLDDSAVFVMGEHKLLVVPVD